MKKTGFYLLDSIICKTQKNNFFEGFKLIRKGNSDFTWYMVWMQKLWKRTFITWKELNQNKPNFAITSRSSTLNKLFQTQKIMIVLHFKIDILRRDVGSVE